MGDKRPVTYKDWRALWHSESKELGFHVAFLFQRNNGRIKMTRELWRDCHRLHRIYTRLKLESEVRDVTWAEAMFELLFKHKI